jgi:SAM-dependent methyltransferase
MTEPMDDATLDRIAAATVDRYRRRFLEHGYGPRALGWGTREQQQYRFEQTLLGPIDFTGRSVLDIGCGFGDYRDFLRGAVPSPGPYRGWDLSPDLIAEAARRHAHDEEASFEVRNLMAAAPPGPVEPVAEIAVMLGVLNFRLEGPADNLRYSELAVRRAWALAGRALVVDFLSSARPAAYRSEDWIFHHDPAGMLALALALSPRVTLKHDYRAIPQREFMIFIERD